MQLAWFMKAQTQYNFQNVERFVWISFPIGYRIHRWVHCQTLSRGNEGSMSEVRWKRSRMLVPNRIATNWIICWIFFLENKEVRHSNRFGLDLSRSALKSQVGYNTSLQLLRKAIWLSFRRTKDSEGVDKHRLNNLDWFQLSNTRHLEFGSVPFLPDCARSHSP